MDLMLSIERIAKRAFSGARNPARGTNQGSLAVAQVEGPNAEMARAGRRFMGGSNILANAIAPKQAMPTTSPTVVLFNTDRSKVIQLDQVGFWLASGTAPVGATLIGALSPLPIASPVAAMATGYATQNCNPASSNASKALFGTSVTLPGAPVWQPLGSNMQSAGTTIGLGDGPIQLGGGILIPPGFGLGLDVLSGAGTSALYMLGLIWNELDLDLE